MNPIYRNGVLSIIIAIAIIVAAEVLPKPDNKVRLQAAYNSLPYAVIHEHGLSNRYVEKKQLYMMAANRSGVGPPNEKSTLVD